MVRPLYRDRGLRPRQARSFVRADDGDLETQPQPALLADGISVALVTTFWGLFIAIPALSMYGVFRNRIEGLVSDAIGEADEIMPKIRMSLKRAVELQQQKKGRGTIESIGPGGKVSRGQPAGPLRSGDQEKGSR